MFNLRKNNRAAFPGPGTTPRDDSPPFLAMGRSPALDWDTLRSKGVHPSFSLPSSYNGLRSQARTNLESDTKKVKEKKCPTHHFLRDFLWKSIGKKYWGGSRSFVIFVYVESVWGESQFFKKTQQVLLRPKKYCGLISHTPKDDFFAKESFQRRNYRNVHGT